MRGYWQRCAWNYDLSWVTLLKYQILNKVDSKYGITTQKVVKCRHYWSLFLVVAGVELGVWGKFSQVMVKRYVFQVSSNSFSKTKRTYFIVKFIDWLKGGSQGVWFPIFCSNLLKFPISVHFHHKFPFPSRSQPSIISMLKFSMYAPKFLKQIIFV